jgi:hypothetical protein
MLEQEFQEEFGVRGVVLGLAGGEGLAIPRQHEGIDGKEHKEVILAQRRDEGALIEFKTEGNRLAGEPRAQGAHPRIDGVWLVFEDAALACRGARHVQTNIVFGISPVDTDEGCKLIPR